MSSLNIFSTSSSIIFLLNGETLYALDFHLMSEFDVLLPTFFPIFLTSHSAIPASAAAPRKGTDLLQPFLAHPVWFLKRSKIVPPL